MSMLARAMGFHPPSVIPIEKRGSGMRRHAWNSWKLHGDAEGIANSEFCARNVPSRLRTMRVICSFGRRNRKRHAVTHLRVDFSEVLLNDP